MQTSGAGLPGSTDSFQDKKSKKKRKKTRKDAKKKTQTSGAGLPASTEQENPASSPSFTTSFSGLTLITGFTENTFGYYQAQIHFRNIITIHPVMLIFY